MKINLHTEKCGIPKFRLSLYQVTERKEETTCSRYMTSSFTAHSMSPASNHRRSNCSEEQHQCGHLSLLSQLLDDCAAIDLPLRDHLSDDPIESKSRELDQCAGNLGHKLGEHLCNLITEVVCCCVICSV